MQNDKIRPCPCCDSEIKGGVRLTGYSMMNRQYIKCDACGLTMETKYSIENMTQEQLKAITKELITRWNTRKPMEQILEQLEEKSSLNHLEKMEERVGKKQTQGFGLGIRCAIDIVKGGVDNAG